MNTGNRVNLWLQTQAGSNPDAPALISENRRLTYRELFEESRQTAVKLSEKGIGEGSHVAIVSENSERYVVVIHALMLLRAVIVPINVRLTAEEISQQMGFADCSHLIENDRIESIGTESAGTDSDTLLLMFTSGSGGEPKCVELTNMNIYFNALGTMLRLQITKNDSWMLSLPLYHIGGISIVFRSVIYGTPVLIPPVSGSDRIVTGMKHYNPSIVSLVPTMMHRIIEQGIRPNPAHRTVLLGGGTVTNELLERCTAAGWKIATTYGMTETSSQAATRNPDDTRHPGSAGQPLPFNRIRIADESGKEMPPETEGEIILQSPSLMKGYYKRDDLTSAAIRGGWFITGDFGRMTADNYLYVASRRSDLIVSGGENIDPLEIEDVILRFPGTKDVCVFPLADDEWGEAVAAAVVASGGNVTVESLKQFLAGKLAPFKVPKEIFIVSTIPDTGHAKRNRRVIGEQIERKYR